MSYFGHPNISNSDLKKFKRMTGGGITEEPANMQAIFDLGTLIHKVILEPHKITDEEKLNSDYDLACKMGKRFFRDPMCRMIILGHDFAREREFYNEVEVGGMIFNARAKADGYREGMKLCLELKGLAIDTERAFKDALERLDYDQGIAHYMLTARCTMAQIVAISKKDPELMFKKTVKQFDDFYACGEEKLISVLRQLHAFSPEDVRRAA